MKLWNAFIIFFLYSLIQKENKTRERECQSSFIIPCIFRSFKNLLCSKFWGYTYKFIVYITADIIHIKSYIFHFWPSICIAESEFFPDRVIQPNSWQSQQWTHYMSVNHSSLTFGLLLNRVRMVPRSHFTSCTLTSSICLNGALLKLGLLLCHPLHLLPPSLPSESWFKYYKL